MNIQRNNKLLVEPPSVATGDIAFNLIVFFLVCASQQPSSGRSQIIPQADAKQQQQQQSQNITVDVAAKGAISINGNAIMDAEFVGKLRSQLAQKKRPEDRVVVVKSADQVEYNRWIQVTTWIEEAGGVITLQIEEKKMQIVN